MAFHRLVSEWVTRNGQTEPPLPSTVEHVCKQSHLEEKKMYNIFRFFSFSHLFPEGVVVGYKREERCSTVKPPAERFFFSSNGRLMQMMGALIILRLLLTLFSFFLSSSSFQTQFSSCVFLSSWRNIREKSWCVISNRCWHGRNSGRESDANFSPSNRFVWVSFM